MHASIEQLLSSLDPLDRASQGTRDHVAACRQCSAELERLEAMRTELVFLPEFPPPPGAWRAIRGHAETAQPSPMARVWRWPAGVALAASAALIAVLVVLLIPRPQPADQLDRDPQAMQQLVMESQRLERALHALQYQPQPRIVNSRTAGTIVALEDRIALVDYGLNYGTEVPLTPLQSERLWRERVELMNSLVKIRYVQRVSY